MASAKPYLTVFSLLFITIFSLSESSTPPSVFEILPEFGLPSGLLPNCVHNYTLSPKDGRFTVDLDTNCYIQFDYLVYYEKRITGTLKMGSITDLKGIQVKRLFLWFDVDEIKVDLPPSDSIYFHVGLISKKLSVHQFETVHSCRASNSRGHLRSWNQMFELPPPIHGEIQMLLTE
ncbi:hypothetical protein SOVF_016780 [Spinacia oleracea]|uniref:DUF538 domain-containing protein n=1 Tax=Spinacia oleracea TaxID=3562 RepID=A0A9R0K4F0_SPIOL|nr:uncharacterized protein LOC110797350 [Spinacia oleracea]KNA24322.1 hypothetical protein SOVF_016780 [Spinacia oleracea]